MAFTEIELARIKKIVGGFVESRRPPAHIRKEIDIAYKIQAHSILIFELREVWKGTPGQMMECMIAKATFARTTGIWKLFWQRRDLKWHGYETEVELKNIEQFVEIIQKDENSCFWG
jgi:Protein of unknown function (DUF3024)